MPKMAFLKTNVGLLLMIILGIIIGFFLGIEYKAYEIRNALTTALQNNDSATTQAINESYIDQIKKTNGSIIDKNIGDTIQFATQNIQVTKVEESNLITPEYGSPIIASQNSKFVFISLNVTNTTKSDITWVTDINVVDDQDRIFSSYDRAIGNVKNYLDMRKLSPGITENGIITYQLPNDAQHYSLLIGKGGTNDYIRVKLK